MNKYTVIHTIRFSKQQAESLKKLKDYDVNIKYMSTIGLKEIAELNDSLAYLFNALEHNDESEHSEKIDKAISLLNEVATDLICHCSVPKAAI